MSVYSLVKGVPKMLPLSKVLKFRLPTWKNQEYWDWCKAQRLHGYQWHHLLGRQYSDFFLVRIPTEVHDRIHHGTGYKEGEYDELFLQALHWLMLFINHKTEK